jgi:hypothetical protein
VCYSGFKYKVTKYVWLKVGSCLEGKWLEVSNIKARQPKTG